MWTEGAPLRGNEIHLLKPDAKHLLAYVARLRSESASKQELFDSLKGDYEKLAAEWSAAVAARDEAQRQLAIHDNWPCPDCEEKEVALRSEAERALTPEEARGIVDTILQHTHEFERDFTDEAFTKLRRIAAAANE